MSKPSAGASPRSEDLTQLASHFEFGENWRDFSQGLSDEAIAEAGSALRRLLGEEGLEGQTFLDIGCGSGLHSLAAIRLGAARVLAMDIDPVGVATASELLRRHAPAARFEVIERSVFALPQSDQFDVVYSWGVLHHTGDMARAIGLAAGAVKPGGRLVLALYRKTPLCGFWKREKQLYARGGRFLRRALEAAYISAFAVAKTLRGQSFARYVRDYRARRGMAFITDVRDWLGGYPYESITPEEMRSLARTLGLRLEDEHIRPPGLGLAGSGCDEYVLRRS